MKRMLATVLAVCMLLMMIPAMSVSAEAIIWPASVGEDVVIDGETYTYSGEMGVDFYDY